MIAIVDDDAPLLSAIGNLLRSAGYRVVLFEHAEAFLVAAAGLEVDLVLTDYQMTGASGIDLMKALNARGCRAPTIIMTAQSFDDVEDQALSFGATHVLAKPFDERELFEAMQAALRRPSSFEGTVV